MKTLIQFAAVAATIVTPMLSQASDALASRYACVACHQAERKVVGPSWKEIAAKYGGGAKTAAQLAASIRSGSTGQWGSMPMQPQPTLPEADATALANWILQRK
jgi:cytochrome c